MIDLTRFDTLIAQLKTQAANLDRTRGEANKPLFDEQLFRCRSKLLTPCVNEIASEIFKLRQEQQSGRLLPTRTQHICEKIVAQIQAVQREFATVSIRKNEPKYRSTHYQPLNEIYQNLNQHKDWERQLKTKLRDKEFELSQCSDWQLQQKLQHEVLVLEGRVSRCQQALTKIEQTIMKRERKG